MKYQHLGKLLSLVCQPKPLVTQRKHPTLDLYIYNYTPAVMSVPIEEFEGKYNVIAIFDDRPQVIRECWQALGFGDRIFNVGGGEEF